MHNIIFLSEAAAETDRRGHNRQTIANRPLSKPPPYPTKRSWKARALNPDDPNDNAFRLVSLFLDQML